MVRVGSDRGRAKATVYSQDTATTCHASDRTTPFARTTKHTAVADRQYLSALVVQRFAAGSHSALAWQTHVRIHTQPYDSSAPAHGTPNPPRTASRRTCAQRPEVVHGLGQRVAVQAHDDAACKAARFTAQELKFHPKLRRHVVDTQWRYLPRRRRSQYRRTLAR